MENLVHKKVVKCVVVGDGTVGKTAMLISYIENKFPCDYLPTVFDNFSKPVTLHGRELMLDLWDTAGQEEYGRLRALSYPGTDIFLVCFSVVFPASLENIKKNWIPEIKHFCPNTPFLLVGLKTDLRRDRQTLDNLEKRNLEPVTQEDGIKLGRELKAINYLECSALTQEGIKVVFSEVLTHGLVPQKLTRRKKCSLL